MCSALNYISPDITSVVFYHGRNRDIRVHADSIKFVSPEKTACVMNCILREHNLCKAGNTVLNMTGNYGGDTVPFIEWNWKGDICEIDPIIADDLRHNMDQYGQNASNFKVHVCNAVDYIGTCGKYDLVVIDPPFGSDYRSYMDANSDDESMDNAGSTYINTLRDPVLVDSDNIPHNMSEVVKMLAGKTRYVLLKMPRIGQSVHNLVNELSEYKCTVYGTSVQKKMDPMHRNHKIVLVMVTM